MTTPKPPTLTSQQQENWASMPDDPERIETFQYDIPHHVGWALQAETSAPKSDRSVLMTECTGDPRANCFEVKSSSYQVGVAVCAEPIRINAGPFGVWRPNSGSHRVFIYGDYQGEDYVLIASERETGTCTYGGDHLMLAAVTDAGYAALSQASENDLAHIANALVTRATGYYPHIDPSRRIYLPGDHPSGDYTAQSNTVSVPRYEFKILTWQEAQQINCDQSDFSEQTLCIVRIFGEND